MPSMAEDPFADLAKTDYTKADERAKAQLRTKWEMCPITQPQNMKTLVLFTMSNVKADAQVGIDKMKDIAAEMSAASQTADPEAAYLQVAMNRRSDVIDFLTENNHELPSAQFMQTRLKSTGERK